MPTKIGVVTSKSGAALQDFLSILKRRGWAGQVLLFNSSVQGREAPTALRKALAQAMGYEGLELIVLTRGGGSQEDLWAFNDASLVRLIAECKTPTISAAVIKPILY